MVAGNNGARRRRWRRWRQRCSGRWRCDVGGLFSDGDGQNGLGAAGGAGGTGLGTPGDGATATLDGAGGAGADPGSAATDTPGGGGGGGSTWDTTVLIGSTTDPGSHPGADTDGSVVITPAPVGQGSAPILQVMKVRVGNIDERIH